MNIIPEKVFEKYIAEEAEGFLLNSPSLTDGKGGKEWEFYMKKADEIYFSGRIYQKLNMGVYTPYQN
jgi:hypothetical protein